MTLVSLIKQLTMMLRPSDWAFGLDLCVMHFLKREGVRPGVPGLIGCRLHHSTFHSAIATESVSYFKLHNTLQENAKC